MTTTKNRMNRDRCQEKTLEEEEKDRSPILTDEDSEEALAVEDMEEQDTAQDVPATKESRKILHTKTRRWDQSSRAGDGKKSYRSWRRYKNQIVQSLLLGNGNIGFVRRTLLFKYGICVPGRVIRYYNFYRSRRPGPQRADQGQNLPDALRDLPTEQRKEERD
ncbi:33 kDa protein [Equine adenovirus 2]|uniref:33 kDa protein n=1 Tax=Equine adenovirus B serotype 2 TaxID=67603 RepID=A0A0K1DBV2_ADEE2|nr:33 kDa protein [Equine adenovirus 2]AKT26037.1 33 kDa protein [Equine adenovirus 2]